MKNLLLPLLILGFCLQAGPVWATSPPALISGQVLSEEGEPLIGVNIQIKEDPSIGTVTDLDGNFRLDVSDPSGKTLVFSYVGYTELEVPIGNRTVLEVVMQASTAALDEVVVVGYGTQKKSDLTGSVASIKSEEINQVSERNLVQTLQGRAAGVMVARTEGRPGAGASIHVRGVGSIGNTGPLWIVDGIRMDPGAHFNPADVESIEILKDAAAAAIYGAQAAHGVILVTTKRGSDNKGARVNFSTQVGQRSAINLPELLETPAFVEIGTRARNASGAQPEDSWLQPNLPNTNWVDEVFSGSGFEQRYNLNISGGNQNANFYVAAGYEKEDGIMVDNYFERFSFRANSDFKVGNRLRIGESLLVTRTNENPTIGNELQGVFRSIPIMPVRDENNPFGGWGTAPTYFQGANPLANQLQNIMMNVNTRINGNFYLEYTILEGLSVRGTVGANIRSGLNEHFTEAFDYGSLANPINQLAIQSMNNDDYTGNIVLNFNRSFGERHVLSATLGYEAFSANGAMFNAVAQDFPTQNAESFALATGTVNISERNTQSIYRLVSQFGRVNYTFDNKYLLSFNVRRDGSSRFGPANRFGIFPSAAVGWRISEEDFMQNLGFISNLKLRASYGVLGSDNISNFLFSSTYWNQRATYTFDGVGITGGTKDRGFYLRRFPNAEVKWEEIIQTNVGLDASFLDGKVDLTMDYYIKTTQDMLFNVPLPFSVGLAQDRSGPESPSINIGEVENRGLEMALTYRGNIGRVRFELTGNGSWNSNEVVRLNSDEFINSGGIGHGGNGPVARTEAGFPMSSFFGFRTEGIFQTEEQVAQYNAGAPDGVYFRNGTAPGDLIYSDLDGDGEITNNDRTFIGNPWPRFIYGLNANLNFKGFDMSVFFQGVAGVDLFNATKAYSRQMFSDYNTTYLAFDGWTAENPNTPHPRVSLNDENGNFRNPSDYFVEDGGFLRLRNLQIGYTLPSSALSRIGIQSARIFVSGQNFITITNYSGYDPETGAGNNVTRGIDNYGKYPNTKLYSAGFQVGF